MRSVSNVYRAYVIATHPSVCQAMAPGSVSRSQVRLILALTLTLRSSISLGLILANVLVVLSLLSLIDGLLTYIGKFWHIERLTLEFLLGYIMYPVAWLIGADGSDIKPSKSTL